MNQQKTNHKKAKKYTKVSQNDEDDNNKKPKDMTESQKQQYEMYKQREYIQKQFQHDQCHIRKQHPDMTPVVIERYEKKFRRVAEWTEGNRYLFKSKDKALHIMIKTQDKVQVPNGDKLWFFVYKNGKPKEIYPQACIGTLHRRYKEGDDNLYIYYTDVNMFPSQERQMMVLQGLVAIIVAIYIYCYFFMEPDTKQYYQDQTNQHRDV